MNTHSGTFLYMVSFVEKDRHSHLSFFLYMSHTCEAKKFLKKIKKVVKNT